MEAAAVVQSISGPALAAEAVQNFIANTLAETRAEYRAGQQGCPHQQSYHASPSRILFRLPVY
jgi:hypothetical protein